jgi:hypothetical protein
LRDGVKKFVVKGIKKSKLFERSEFFDFSPQRRILALPLTSLDLFGYFLGQAKK